ncbi:hypothetical protein PC114_g12563 [Phytophthora cactorum]|nr:hypothetical protein PC114_g12563 [Phytophthora cactorum]
MVLKDVPGVSGGEEWSSIDASFMDEIPNYEGLENLLNLPFRDGLFCTTDYILAKIHRQKWIDHYMENGKLTPKAHGRLGALCTPLNSGLQKGSMDLTIPNSLYRTSTTLYMSWCLRPDFTSLSGVQSLLKGWLQLLSA